MTYHLSQSLRSIRVKDLYAQAVDVKPVPFEWSENPIDYDGFSDDDNPNSWRFWEAVECYGCNKTTDAQGVCQNEKCEQYDGDPSETREGPMMNYYYPLSSWSGDIDGFDPDAAAKALVHVPVCVVLVGDTYGLALTGGGMDLTWEICEAYIRLGILPPTHFAGLPNFAGKGANADNLKIVAACRRSVRIQRNWLNNKLSDLDRVTAWLHKESDRRREYQASASTSS